MHASLKKVIITGGSGFLGHHLVGHLKKHGYDVVVIDRVPSRHEGVETVIANLMEHIPSDERLAHPYAYIHLAGKNIFGRFTKKHKYEIHASRTVGTRNLIQFLKNKRYAPRVLVSASAVGFYGERGDELLNESSDQGQGFLSEVVSDWEHEVLQARFFDMRTAIFRQGHIMGTGGFLGALVPSFQKGLGGPIGKGTQWLPWIHIHDVVNFYREALENDTIEGIYNMTSKTPTRYSDMSRALARALGRPHWIRIPRWLLAFAFGKEFAREMTVSQRIISHRLADFHYETQWNNITACIDNLYGS